MIYSTILYSTILYYNMIQYDTYVSRLYTIINFAWLANWQTG